MAVVRLTEDFNSSFPDWLVSKLNNSRGRSYNSFKDGLLKKGIDLNRATFVSEDPPTSSRDPRLKDMTMIPVFQMRDGSLYSPRIKDSGGYIYYYDNNGKGQYGNANSLPWKTVLANTKNFGYIDVTDAANLTKDLRAQRDSSRRGMIDRNREANYKRPIYGDKKDEFGSTSRDPDNIVGYKWITKSGYDKSGYPLDPEKYVRMLNTIDMSNYAQKLKRYYDMIKKAQSDLSTAIASADIDNLRYRGRSNYLSNNVMSDIQDAASALTRAISDYRDIQRNIERIVNRPNMSDEEKNEYLQSWWGPHGKSVYDYVNEANEYMKAVLTNASYED